MFGDAGDLVPHLIIIVPDVLALTPEGYVSDLVVGVDEQPDGEEDHQGDAEPPLARLAYESKLLQVGVAAEAMYEEDVLAPIEIGDDLIQRRRQLPLQVLLRGTKKEAEVARRGLVDKLVCQLVRPADVSRGEGKVGLTDLDCRPDLADRLDAHKVIEAIDEDVDIEAHTVLCGEVGEQQAGREKDHIGQPDATPEDPASLIDHLDAGGLEDVEDDEAEDRNDEGNADAALSDQRSERRPDEEEDDDCHGIGILSPKLEVILPDQTLGLLLIHIGEVIGADVGIESLHGGVEDLLLLHIAHRTQVSIEVSPRRLGGIGLALLLGGTGCGSHRCSSRRSAGYRSHLLQQGLSGGVGGLPPVALGGKSHSGRADELLIDQCHRVAHQGERVYVGS